MITHPKAKNPNNAREALAIARRYVAHDVTVLRRQCDHYVGVWYGYEHSGETNALAHFRHIPPEYRLPSTSAMHGALAFYAHMDKHGDYFGEGHVAIINAGGRGKPTTIITPDAPHATEISEQPFGFPETKWGMVFIAMTQPLFPHGIATTARRVPWFG